MKNQKGFTIVEVVISLTIIGFLFLTLLAGADQIRTYNKTEQVKMFTSRLVTSISHLAFLKSTLRASTLQSHLPSNEEFAEQIYRQKESLHNNNGSFVGVALFLPIIEVTLAGEILSGGQITGTPDHPLRYNILGHTCDTAYEQCLGQDWPIEVITDYNFSCPPLFHKTYDFKLRGGSPYSGPVVPNGLYPYFKCRFKSQLNLRLTIRETIDSSVTNSSGYMKDYIQIIQIPLTNWPSNLNP